MLVRGCASLYNAVPNLQFIEEVLEPVPTLDTNALLFGNGALSE